MTSFLSPKKAPKKATDQPPQRFGGTAGSTMTTMLSTLALALIGGAQVVYGAPWQRLVPGRFGWGKTIQKYCIIVQHIVSWCQLEDIGKRLSFVVFMKPLILSCRITSQHFSSSPVPHLGGPSLAQSIDVGDQCHQWPHRGGWYFNDGWRPDVRSDALSSWY